jgi:type IV pilus assembly protein PilA
MRSRTRNQGFTLIELLVVVVIISILAAIAIPKFNNTKGKAQVTKLKSDLRNMATAQESYFYDNAMYTTNLAALNMTPSDGVVFTTVTSSVSGWSAIVTHPQSWPLQCGIFFGSEPPPFAGMSAGVIKCQ